MEQDPSKKRSDHHGLAIAVGGAVAATVAGVAAAEGVRRLQGAKVIREARRKEARADPTSLLNERILTYRNGTVVTTVAALLGHAGPMSYESLKKVAGLTKNQVSSSLGWLASRNLVQRVREDMSRPYSVVRLDPAVPAAIYDRQDAFRPFIATTIELYPEFDLDSLADGPEPNDNL
ncbi:hypothetical protein EYC59_01420 [Candidatus Saccharibacteria bacterium]|nr:MAG: hypothetical protein EYC59_01420 [Candidatus Saccharibacteria bacterium]